ncbi:hypothetical protein PISMIDRAFT_12976 [Pisolithus microcarpus 441]|uniref:Uncharacterized protein n=1 Tax=Pisolithus microcarpus 441 TaxID=765257 RepID=A0A0C9ZDI0_9AGAM|nr:hypothetical protein PISMIDRAFT_12976 [Pisolithus microcarpus 441]
MSSSTAILVDPESTDCEEQHSKPASADVFPLSLPRWDVYVYYDTHVGTANTSEGMCRRPPSLTHVRPFGMVIETMWAGHFFGRKPFSRGLHDQQTIIRLWYCGWESGPILTLQACMISISREAPSPDANTLTMEEVIDFS